MEYYAIVRSGESLSHHGILGMKWGVRRFQNPDGTLTEEGKRRYRITESGEIQKLSRKERKDLALKKRMPMSEEERQEKYKAELRDLYGTPEKRKAALDKAKNEDKWNMEFLEVMQNTDMFSEWGDDSSGAKRAMLKAYEQFMEDPINFHQKVNDIDRSYRSTAKHEDLAGDFLAHYGILGMKWGVRRYQNMDGTLTPEGKAKRDAYLERHYGKATKKLERIDTKYKKRQAKADKKFVKAQKKEFSPFSSLESADKAHEKAMRAQKRANMTIAKGKKWSDQMIKEFSKTGMTIDPKTVKMNEDYTNRMLMIAESMYASNIHKRR